MESSKAPVQAVHERRRSHDRRASGLRLGVSQALLFSRAKLYAAVSGMLGTASLLAAELFHSKCPIEGCAVASRVFETLGVTLLAGASVALVLEVVLSKERNNSLKETVEEALAPHVPENYKNIRKHGIKDCYHQLDILSMQDKIRETRSRIRIMVIWIPQLDVLRASLLDAIRSNDARLDILLCDPDQKDALEKRAKSVPGYNLKDYQNNIDLNLRILSTIERELRGTALADKMEVRRYRGFISTSLYGYGENFILGIYLDGRLSTSGLQFRVTDSTSSFYNELDRHFTSCWEQSSSGKVVQAEWDEYFRVSGAEPGTPRSENPGTT